MLWASKRRKSRPDVPKASLPPQTRRSSLGSIRLPFASLDPHQATDMSDSQNLYGRSILSADEQQRVARQNTPSPSPNFSLPRRDTHSTSSSASSSRRDVRDAPDMIYTTNSLDSFSFGPATAPPPSPGRSIGPLDEVDEDDMRRRADETPRQSLAGNSHPARRDPRTPAAHYSPSRSDAASHHTFGTSSASSLSSPSRSGSRSRTTSSTTHTSVDDYLGGVTFNPMHHHPALPPDVEFDSEEDELSEEYDAIEVSSARGGSSIEGAAYEAAFERQMYSDPLTGRRPSLPMAIPGAPPDDDREHAGRHPRDRERQGSLATLRRPSRSLDDQVSILTLTAPRDRDSSSTVTGTAQPPTAPVSVPETDGDWRSLSMRAAHRGSPSPTIPTMPTFASGGAIDNFGFDTDWGTMKMGITGLNMDDVAVYAAARASMSRDRRPSQLSLMLRRPSTASAGSMMYDPDTFTAAVRGWGGEEYERQRKYWTFRRDAADGRGGGGGRGRGGGGGALSPVRSITGGRVGMGIGIGGRAGGGGSSILSGVTGQSYAGGERTKHVPWKGMQLNAEEIWNSSLVGSFKVRRIELRPTKPQQRVTIDPFRGPYTLGPKPPHDGAYTNIHKHSKVMAFSIHRHYKPSRSSVPDARGNTSTGTRGSVSARGTARYEERRRPTAMILLAPRHVQEAYTSTNTTKGLRSHGLLDEGRERDRERGAGREKEKEKGRQNGSTNGGKGKAASIRQLSSTGSTGSAYRDVVASPPPPPPPPPSPPAPAHTYPPPAPTPLDAGLGARSASTSRRRRRDSLDADSDSDTERVPSRTTHNEAFSTMDASSIDQMVLAQDAMRAHHGEGANGVLSRVLRRAPAHPAAAPHSVYVPPWVTLQSRVKQEERRRRHDVLSNSFEDVGLLPPKKSSGFGARAKKPVAAGVDIFAQVPPDALFMLLPLWPGPTDPVSERMATKAPHEIPTEQRQYLLVSYKPTDERAPQTASTGSKKHDGGDGGGRKNRSKGSSHSSPTSSADASGSGGKGCDILLASYHISARLVSHADLQGSGVRVPDEGLAVLGPWDEACRSMPQIATRDHGLLVIGRCASREAGVEFDPEGLVKMGLCIPVESNAAAAAAAAGVPEELQEEPVAELTPIGKAVLEMAWIGCIAVTSFGPTGPS
ncbi:hypothetical protein DFH09DRAFT_1052726 [Mycena vulgaris]|nr:hypothetical protein DFH09DRAFT_1052726 [Mycena vulgaris]